MLEEEVLRPYRSVLMPRFALHGASFCTAAVPLQLADVVDEAIEQPLYVHLGRAAQAEALQPSGMSDVGEYGLHGAQASSVFVPPALGVDLALHARAVGLRFSGNSSEEDRDLAYGSAFGVPQALRAQLTRLAVTLGAFEFHRLDAVNRAVPAASI